MRHNAQSPGAAWGSKDGNPPRTAQLPVVAAGANSVELANPDPVQDRAPTTEPSHSLPQNDSHESQSVELETVAKKRETQKQPEVEQRPAAPAPSSPAPSKGGFLKRLFGVSSRQADPGNGGEEASGPMITLFTGRVKPLPAPEPAQPEPPQPGALKEDTLRKLGELERLREENAALKRKLDDERQAVQKQLGQLEMQNNEFRSAADKARGEKGDVEARTAVLRKSVSALERQMAEEREHFGKELDEASKQRDTLLQDNAELNEKIAKLEKELENVTATSARSTQSGLSTEIGASHAHISRLESLVQRLEDEVELLQRELSTEKERFRRNNDEWEEKLRQHEQAASQAALKKSRVEGSAGMLQAAIEALEQQVREQREAMEVQMKLLESERAQSRARAGEFEQKLKAQEAQLEAHRARHAEDEEPSDTVTKFETALTETRTHSLQVESRIALLEAELAAARGQVLKEAEASAARIERFEARWQEIQQQLLPKDEELQILRPQVSELKAKVGLLESELAGAKPAAARLSADAQGTGGAKPMNSTGDPTFSQAGVRLPAEVAEPFYHQSMAPITVMLACADILGMSRKLDPSLKSTAEEFKTQTHLLLELIKSYTLPPDSKSN